MRPAPCAVPTCSALTARWPARAPRRTPQAVRRKMNPGSSWDSRNQLNDDGAGAYDAPIQTATG